MPFARVHSNSLLPSKFTFVAVAVCWIALGYGAYTLDVSLTRRRGAFMPVAEGGILDQVLDGLRNFAQILTVVTTIVIVTFYDRGRRKPIIAAIIVGQAVAMAGYGTCKRLVGRYRPEDPHVTGIGLDHLDASQTWIGWSPGNAGWMHQSFPSGHSAAAFALAGVLAPFYRRVGWMFWFLAVGCATSRYLHAVHWPSDCVAGALLGYLGAMLGLGVALRVQRVRAEPFSAG